MIINKRFQVAGITEFDTLPNLKSTLSAQRAQSCSLFQSTAVAPSPPIFNRLQHRAAFIQPIWTETIPI